MAKKKEIYKNQQFKYSSEILYYLLRNSDTNLREELITSFKSFLLLMRTV